MPRGSCSWAAAIASLRSTTPAGTARSSAALMRRAMAATTTNTSSRMERVRHHDELGYVITMARVEEQVVWLYLHV
eukprot:scaffold57756_cov67-Phaeocystis_antarctica.AAC.2